MAYDISNGVFHVEAGEETQGRLSIKSKHMVTGEYDMEVETLCSHEGCSLSVKLLQT